MRFQLHGKFSDNTHEQHNLPLPCVAFDPQKPLRVALMPVSKVLVLFVAKNPLGGRWLLSTRGYFLLYPWHSSGALNITSSTMALCKSRTALMSRYTLVRSGSWLTHIQTSLESGNVYNPIVHPTFRRI
jgi:hypothetical protein